MPDPIIYRADPQKFRNADAAICNALGAMHECAPNPETDPQAKLEHRSQVDKLVDIRMYLLKLEAANTPI